MIVYIGCMPSASLSLTPVAGSVAEPLVGSVAGALAHSDGGSFGLPGGAVACCGPSATGTISEEQAEAAAALLKAVADPTRLRLLSLIRNSAACEACVCDLAEAVSLSQPTVSHHLRKLVAAGILEREARGTWAWYRIIPDQLESIAAILR